MPLDPVELEKFAALIAMSTHNEVECGGYLEYAANYLSRTTALSIIGVKREDRTHYGSSDFIIFYKCKNAFGRLESNAIIWEIKAPQCYLMERDDNNNRCRPTKDFVKAENQLVHYYQEISNNTEFLNRNSIPSRDHIKIGGIIIGRDSRIIDIDKYPNMLSAAENSLRIRCSNIYDKSGFVIYTWDRIFDYLSHI